MPYITIKVVHLLIYAHIFVNKHREIFGRLFWTRRKKAWTLRSKRSLKDEYQEENRVYW